MVEPQALFDAAVAAKAQGDTARAEGLYHELLAVRPDAYEAWFNLANCQGVREDWAAVVKSLSHIPQGHDLYAAAQRNLGVACRSQGHLKEAVEAFECAVHAAPDDGAAKVALAQALSDLGGVLRVTIRTANAVALLERAVTLAPDDASLAANLALCYLWNGDPEAALAAYGRALALDPDNAEMAYGRATVLLSLGRWAEGWAAFESRLACADSPLAKIVSDAPLWDGTPMPERTILLWAEQGLGDTVQFVRFAARLKAMGMRVMMACRKGLMPLLASVPDLDGVVDIAAPLPIHDVRLPVMSLPHRLGLDTADALAVTTPYLAADPERVRLWAAQLGPKTGLRVGLCWKGSPKYANDPVRSIPLRALVEGLSDVAGVELVSLQVGLGAEDADRFAAVRSLGPDFDAGPEGLFMDAAAVMASLDAVVTVDTAIAHVAGALGVPVKLLQSAVPDWRWGHDGATTPWYASMGLYRQSRLGHWSDPLAVLASDLTAMENR